MKTKIGILVLVLCASFFNVKAQRTYTTTRATSYDISDNLDLDAVSSIFAESRDLKDFEYRLNDPDNRISNLDLNGDGYVDYLRVVETTDNRNSLVVVQAVLDDNVFQDVATIEIDRVQDGRHRIQVVGDPWIYGPDYIIEPVFARTPLIFSFFWGPRYSPWNSPFYWGYYPRSFYSYRPYSTPRYCRHVNIYVNRNITFNRINERHFRFDDDRFNRIRRNDFANRHPDRSFENRHRESTNIGRQQQRQPSRSIENQPQRRIENGNTNRSNETRSRDMERNRVDQQRRQVNQDRQRETQQREVQRSRETQQNREYSRPNQNQVQQRNQTIEQQRAPQSRPEVREKFRQRIDNAPSERSGSIQQRGQSKKEVRQSNQNTRKAEPAKKEEKKESRERRRNE
jgi:hypothetical protein